MLERKWFASTLLRAHSFAVQNSVGRGAFFLPHYASVALYPTTEQALSMHCTRIPLSSLPEERAEQAAYRNPKPISHTGSLGRTKRRSPPHHNHELLRLPAAKQPLTHPHPRYLIVAIHASIQEDVDYSFVTVPRRQVQGSVFLCVAA